MKRHLATSGKVFLGIEINSIHSWSRSVKWKVSKWEFRHRKWPIHVVPISGNITNYSLPDRARVRNLNNPFYVCKLMNPTRRAFSILVNWRRVTHSSTDFIQRTFDAWFWNIWGRVPLLNLVCSSPKHLSLNNLPLNVALTKPTITFQSSTYVLRQSTFAMLMVQR